MSLDIGFTQLARVAGQAAHAEEVWIFGSQARGDASAYSDVDVALVLPDSANRREALRAALSATRRRTFSVDFVVLAKSTLVAGSTLLARQIRKEGVRV